MTKRKPLRWFEDKVWGSVPDCVECSALLFRPLFIEAVYSVAIEHSGSDPADMARRTINQYHADRHPDPEGF